MEQRILVIEDQRDIAELVRMHIRDLGHQVEIAGDGDEGLRMARAQSYALIVLDVMLPGRDGLDLARQLRMDRDPVPILMLTARSGEIDRVLGLELGADDYLTKPFSIPELQARIKAMLRRSELSRRSGPAQNERITVDSSLVIDTASREVRIDGAEASLTSKEFDLLLHFARNPGRVFSRMQLLDAVWGTTFEGYEHNVNTHINRLRAKIERDPAAPRYVLTVRGAGYRFSHAQPPPR
jgi:DNA-binding response OmpR family regulator